MTIMSDEDQNGNEWQIPRRDRDGLRMAIPAEPRMPLKGSGRPIEWVRKIGNCETSARIRYGRGCEDVGVLDLAYFDVEFRVREKPLGRMIGSAVAGKRKGGETLETSDFYDACDSSCAFLARLARSMIEEGIFGSAWAGKGGFIYISEMEFLPEISDHEAASWVRDVVSELKARCGKMRVSFAIIDGTAAAFNVPVAGAPEEYFAAYELAQCQYLPLARALRLDLTLKGKSDVILQPARHLNAIEELQALGKYGRIEEIEEMKTEVTRNAIAPTFMPRQTKHQEPAILLKREGISDAKRLLHEHCFRLFDENPAALIENIFALPVSHFGGEGTIDFAIAKHQAMIHSYGFVATRAASGPDLSSLIAYVGNRAKEPNLLIALNDAGFFEGELSDTLDNHRQFLKMVILATKKEAFPRWWNENNVSQLKNVVESCGFPGNTDVSNLLLVASRVSAVIATMTEQQHDSDAFDFAFFGREKALDVYVEKWQLIARATLHDLNRNMERFLGTQFNGQACSPIKAGELAAQYSVIEWLRAGTCLEFRDDSGWCRC